MTLRQITVTQSPKRSRKLSVNCHHSKALRNFKTEKIWKLLECWQIVWSMGAEKDTFPHTPKTRSCLKIQKQLQVKPMKNKEDALWSSVELIWFHRGHPLLIRHLLLPPLKIQIRITTIDSHLARTCCRERRQPKTTACGYLSTSSKPKTSWSDSRIRHSSQRSSSPYLLSSKAIHLQGRQHLISAPIRFPVRIKTAAEFCLKANTVHQAIKAFLNMTNNVYHLLHLSIPLQRLQ